MSNPSTKPDGQKAPPAAREQETPEEAEAAQRQMEAFARLAQNVQAAVGTLEDAFLKLDDCPISVDAGMAQLVDAAKYLAADAREWAREGNADWAAACIGKDADRIDAELERPRHDDEGGAS